MAKINTTYRTIPASSVPAGLTWDTPHRNGGQIIEVSYGDVGRGAPDEGSLYRCTTHYDEGGRMVYAMRVGPMWMR